MQGEVPIHSPSKKSIASLDKFLKKSSSKEAIKNWNQKIASA